MPTDAETEEMCSELERGGFIETSWALVGISRDMGREWLDRGRRDPSGPFGPHALRVAQARECGIEVHRLRVDAGAQVATLTETTYDGDGNVVRRKEKQDRGDWKAAAWALERIDPARFIARVRLEVEGEMTAVLEVLERELDSDTYARVLEALARLGKSADAT